MLSDELEGKGIAASGDTVGTRVVGTLNSAVLSAVVSVGTKVRPRVAVVAVLIAVYAVDPAPVGVDDDLAVDVGAATGGGTFLPGELGVAFGLLGADLLG